ncbi:MAG: PP2C family protein-serine/threonine phosphatase, partial [Akkermansiaceae bacterium]
MSDLLYLLLAVVAVLFAILLLVIRRVGQKLDQTTREKNAIVGEEQRMFAFLHDLGLAIEQDISPTRLHREIVEGFCKVVEADGAALYRLNDDRTALVPKHISINCPPLVGLPLEVKQRAVENPGALESHLRLAKSSADDGILGAVLSSGECLWIENVKDHDAFRDSFVSYDDNVAAMLAPLTHAGRDLGVVAVASKHEEGKAGARFSENDFDVFRSVAEQSAFALGNAMIHEELAEKRKLDDEIRTASQVQSVLLPDTEPNIPGFRVHGSNTPARMISGDYFDYIKLDTSHTGIVIADVSGKGVPAGLLMAMCRSTLRLSAHEYSQRDGQGSAEGKLASPSQALARVNRQLFPDVREDMFVSAAYLVLDHSNGKVELSRAGHDAPLLYRAADQSIEVVKPPGLAIGIDEGGVFERVTKDVVLEMSAGDCLLLFTDGVCEAVDVSGDEFG